MTTHRKVSLTTLALLSTTMIALGCNPIFGVDPERIVPSRLPPADLTEDEKLFLSSLDRARLQCWSRRFDVGLTKEQRKYVDEQIKALKES